jgi:putative transposase
MANTYSQCYFQLVFAVKHRNALIKIQWKDKLEMYVTGIVRNYHHKLLAIGAMPEHIHIFIGYNLNQLIPDLVQEIKTSTSAWINGEKLSDFHFAWQKGYGAFTYSHYQLDTVIRYVISQEEHHKRQSFKREYIQLLEMNNVEFRNEYLFDFFDGINNWI